MDWYLLWVAIALMLCSIIPRVCYFLFGAYLPLNDTARRALRYAPGAALVAIIIPNLFPLSSDGTMTIAVDQLLAAVAAVLVFLHTRNTLLVIGLGMVVLWLVRWLFALLGGGAL